MEIFCTMFVSPIEAAKNTVLMKDSITSDRKINKQSEKPSSDRLKSIKGNLSNLAVGWRRR